MVLDSSFLLCGLFTACENNMKTLPNYRQKQISVDEGKKITAYLSENAKVKAKLTAPYMRRSEMDSPYVEFPNTLHVDFYNDSLTDRKCDGCALWEMEGAGRKSISAGQCGGYEYSERRYPCIARNSGGIRRQKNFIRINRSRFINPAEPYCMVPVLQHRRISVVIPSTRLPVLLPFPAEGMPKN